MPEQSPEPAIQVPEPSLSDIRPVPDQNLAAGDFSGALRIIESGDAYVNVHTVNFPGGEIRGEVKSED